MTVHRRLRKIWLTWVALLVGALVALSIGLGVIARHAADDVTLPELDQTSQVIGQALGARIEQALAYRIPIHELVGVDDWFAGIIAATPDISGLMLTDQAGTPLASIGIPPAVAEQLRQRRATQAATVGEHHAHTLALHDRDARVVGWLHVVSIAPPVANTPWLWSALAIVPCSVVAALALWLLLRRRLLKPLTLCAAAAESLKHDELPDLPALSASDPAALLQTALARRIHALRKQRHQVIQKIAEVRAAHFAPAVLQALDALAQALAARGQDADSALRADASQPRPKTSLSLRAEVAGGLALLLIACGLLGVHVLRQQEERQRLIDAGERSLRQLWQATLEQEQLALDANLRQMLAQPSFRSLLAGRDDQALDVHLESLGTPQMTLAVFGPDGKMRAASGFRDQDTQLDSVTLEPLRQQDSIIGIWRNTGRFYQNGIVQQVRLEAAGGEKLAAVMVAHPLERSLADLARRLDGKAGIADPRGHPVYDNSASLVAEWRAHEKRSRLLDDAASPRLLLSLPLIGSAGRRLGTLVAEMPAPYRQGAGTDLLIWLAIGTATAGALALLLYLRQLPRPMRHVAQRLERLADGNTDSTDGPVVASKEEWLLQHGMLRLAGKIDTLEMLQRSRIRQGRRQSRFIRHQMMDLASSLDENARAAILSDLEHMEDTARSVPAPVAAELSPDRVVDEFGVLSAGFQNLVSRVGAQYRELDRLVAELREALRTKTEYIALQQELEIARQLQLSILPHEFDVHPALELHATMRPAKEVGGDFYDFFMLDEHRVALVVADVSGKGVPAAFFMAVARTLLRAIAQFSSSPSDCIGRLNDLLAADNQGMMFVTLFYAVVDMRDGTVTYVNAGHNPPFLLRAADDGVTALPSTRGIALAVAEDMPFRQMQLKLAEGDGLFLYTDGITEACAPDESQYGEARLIAALHQSHRMSTHEVPAHIVAQVREFEAGGTQADDITCLMARYRGCR